MIDDLFPISIQQNNKYTGYFTSAKSGIGPGIVLIQEIFGVNKSMHSLPYSYAFW